MSISQNSMDRPNYVKGFTSAITGVAAGAAARAALNAGVGTMKGASAAMLGAIGAVTNYAGDAQVRNPYATTMPASPTTAANTAVNNTTPKTDPMQQAMMNAMMQQMMKDNLTGKSATRSDGSIETSKLDQRVLAELGKMHEGMKNYAKQMQEIIDNKLKDKGVTKNEYTGVIDKIQSFTDDVKKYSDPSKDNKEFNPGKINESYKELKALIDSKPALKNDKNIQEYMKVAEKADKQATVMKGIATGDNKTYLNLGDKLKDESLSSLEKDKFSIPDDQKNNEKFKTFDSARESLIDATKNLSNDEASQTAHTDALRNFESSFKAIKEDPSIDTTKLEKNYDQTMKTEGLLQRTQDLSSKELFDSKSNIIPEIKTSFDSLNSDVYDFVKEKTGGDQTQIRDFYSKIDIKEPETPAAKDPELNNPLNNLEVDPEIPELE